MFKKIARPFAFVFPGQGSQFVGMGKDIYNSLEMAKNLMDKADKILGEPITNLCFNGPAQALDLTKNASPAILITSFALYYSLYKSKIAPDYVLGHSLGEYTAAVVASSITYEEAIKVVRARAIVMQNVIDTKKGGMAAILGLNPDSICEICKEVESATGETVEIANINCPGQIVISGHIHAVKKACNLCVEKGAKRALILSVSIPSHCSIMKKAAPKLTSILENIHIKNPLIPMVSNVTAKFVESGQELKSLLIKQIYSPVLWNDSIRFLISRGVRHFVEVGPGKILTGIIKRIDKKISTYNIQSYNDIVSFKQEVSL